MLSTTPGFDEDAADLRDRAQHQRAIADQVLDEIFGVQAVLDADDRHVLRQQLDDRRTRGDVVVDLGGQQDQRARLDRRHRGECRQRAACRSLALHDQAVALDRRDV